MDSFLLEFIDNVPKLFSYFVPGALFLSINHYICSKKKVTYEYFIFKSMIVSYLMIIISNGAFELIKIVNPNTIKPILPIIIAIISSYVLSIFYMSGEFEGLLSLLKIRRTVHDNFWTDIIDYKNGTYFRVYLKDERLIYYGAIIKHEEKDDNNYLLMSNYTVYDYDGNIIEEYETDEECIVLNTNNINRFEISYSSDSVKVKRGN